MRLFSSYHKTTYKKEKMDLNYKAWLLKKLTKPEFAIYSLILEIGVGTTTINQIAQYANCHRHTAYSTMKSLEKKTFLLYVHVGNTGIHLLWLRSQPNEIVPEKEVLAQEISATVKSPEGTIYNILPGKIEQFAREKAISAMTLRDLITGKSEKNRSGWTLIKGFSIPTANSIPTAKEAAITAIAELDVENRKEEYYSLLEKVYRAEQELINLREKNKTLQMTVKSLQPSPEMILVSIKYINQLKGDIEALKNQNAWLKSGKVA